MSIKNHGLVLVQLPLLRVLLVVVLKKRVKWEILKGKERKRERERGWQKRSFFAIVCFGMAYGESCYGVHGVANGSVGQTGIMGVNKIVALLWQLFHLTWFGCMIIIHLVSKHFARGCKEKVILKEKKSISNSGKFIKVGQFF